MKQLLKSLEEYKRRMVDSQPKRKMRLQHYINIVNELLDGKRKSD